MPPCPNCAAELNGLYCSHCGQARIGPNDLSARRFFHDLADETGGLRFKFKTLRSLRALLTPGLLTSEYVAGRRQAYLTPLQLYFVGAALFFLAAPFAGFTLTAMMASDESGELASLVVARAADRGLNPAMLAQRFDLQVKSVYTLALGTGVIAVAGTLQLLCRSNLRFGAHLVFALHYYCFLYLATAATGAVRQLGVLEDVAALLAVCLIGAYLFFALRLNYAGPTALTLLRWAAVLIVVLAFNYLADTTAVRLTLALL